MRNLCLWSGTALESSCHNCLKARQWLNYLFTYLPTYLLTYLQKHLPTYIVTYLLTYLLTYLVTYLPTYLRPYLLTYLLTSLLTYLFSNLFLFILLVPKQPMYGHCKVSPRCLIVHATLESLQKDCRNLSISLSFFLSVSFSLSLFLSLSLSSFSFSQSLAQPISVCFSLSLSLSLSLSFSLSLSLSLCLFRWLCYKKTKIQASTNGLGTMHDTHLLTYTLHYSIRKPFRSTDGLDNPNKSSPSFWSAQWLQVPMLEALRPT